MNTIWIVMPILIVLMFVSLMAGWLFRYFKPTAAAKVGKVLNKAACLSFQAWCAVRCSQK